MLTLLALVSAAGTGSTAGFAGGAFVGAQAGFAHIEIKRQAKDKAATKEDAGKAYDALTAGLADAKSYTVYDSKADADDIKKIKDFDSGIATVKVTISDKADSDAIVKAIGAALDDYKKNNIADIKSSDFKGVNIAILGNAGQKIAATDDEKAKLAKAVSDVAAKNKKDDFVKEIVNLDAEGKYTSNNGFAGLHVGYLGRVNDKFLAGAIVEGNWVFGQDMKFDLTSTTEPDTKARFNVNAYLRAMFNLTGNFMAGVDVGVSGQEIRTKKKDAAADNKSNNESNWFWGPAARLVLGVALTDNVLATAHFGGVFPIKQDHFKRDSGFKAKYTNFTGGVGISYVFGG